MPKLKPTEYAVAYTQRDAEAKSLKENNDCAVKALSIVSGRPYAEVHAMFAEAGRKERKATPNEIIYVVIAQLGLTVTKVSLTQIRLSYPKPHCTALKNVTTHHPRRFPEQFPQTGTYLMWTSRHIVAIKDGVVCDYSINNAKRAYRMELVTVAEAAVEEPQPST